jgi:hypothetical protein
VKPHWYLGLFGLLAVLLAFGVNAWSRLETLTCDREAKRVRCAVTRDAWLTSDSVVYPDVVDIRTLDLTRDQWAVTIVDRRGDVDDAAEEITEGEAKRFVASVVAGDAHVEVARERYPWRLAIFNLSMLLCLVGVAWGFLLQRRARRDAPRTESTD